MEVIRLPQIWGTYGHPYVLAYWIQDSGLSLIYAVARFVLLSDLFCSRFILVSHLYCYLIIVLHWFMLVSFFISFELVFSFLSISLYQWPCGVFCMWLSVWHNWLLYIYHLLGVYMYCYIDLLPFFLLNILSCVRFYQLHIVLMWCFWFYWHTVLQFILGYYISSLSLSLYIYIYIYIYI